MTNLKLLLCAGLLATTGASAQTYLECDFEQGIPQSFTLIDNDGLTPSASMATIGFAAGTPWIAYTPVGESGQVACSTSWYTPAGQSDDWMITPAFTVSDDGAVLRWRAMASDKRHKDGYAVYVSTKAGTSIADFDTTTPLFTVAEEENSWTNHRVSLDAYKGQTITVAFVNNSTDKSRLYVDDIFAGVHTAATLTVDLGRSVARMGETAVSGTAYTDSDEPINGFTIGLEYGGETFTQQFNETLTAGNPVKFTLDKTLNLGFHETTPYSVWIETNGSRYTHEQEVTAYPRRVVCEEGTGTWCSWCVRGHVMLDSIRMHHSDWLIGIAAHSGDVMANDYYSGIVTHLAGGGLPAGTVNRKLYSDPRDFITTSTSAFYQETVFVAMQAEASLDEATRTVETETKLWFAEGMNNADYRLGYAILENNVHKPDDSKYDQYNSAYSGGGNGPMGGYENKGKYVPASEMWYQDVARGYVDDITGVAGSVPAEFGADEELTYCKSFTLPDGILDDKNTALVVMLIDQSDGHIVNAVMTTIGENGLTGISNVNATAGDNTPTAYFTPDGRRHSTPQKGLNIVRLGNGRVIKKVF